MIMNPNSLHTNIKLAFHNTYGYNIPIKYQSVLSSIEHVVQTSNNNMVTFTKMKVLLEGIYQSISEDSELRKPLEDLRYSIWKVNAGEPSVEFLDQYKKQIDETMNSVNSLNWSAYNHNEYSVNLSNLWQITPIQG